MKSTTFTIGIAPDSFKGTLSAADAADAMARGARRVYPKAEILQMEMADGGEGTSELLSRSTGGSAVTLPTTDPLGRPIQATVHRLGDDSTWAVDTAAASGLTLLTPDERDPGRTCSAGTGALIRAAVGQGARTVILGLGGSATVDGGTGLCRALGVRWLDDSGHELPPGGDALGRLSEVDDSAVPPTIRDLQIRVAHDVNNPLTGTQGAAAIFAPQKGADAAGVRRLTTGLQRLVDVLSVRELAQRAGTGAAGGMAVPLLALFDATLEPGASLVFEQAGWAAQLSRCDLVLVAEGRLDAQTAAGKAPAHVAAEAARLDIPVLAVAGTLGPGASSVPHIQQAEAIHESAPQSLPSPQEAATELADATARLLTRWSRAPSAASQK